MNGSNRASVAPLPAQPLEEHYMQQRHVLLSATAIAPIVSAISNMTLSGVSYSGWSGLWMLLRILWPFALIPIKRVKVQRIGLAFFAVFLVVGLFRWGPR